MDKLTLPAFEGIVGAVLEQMIWSTSLVPAMNLLNFIVGVECNVHFHNLAGKLAVVPNPAYRVGVTARLKLRVVRFIRSDGFAQLRRRCLESGGR